MGADITPEITLGPVLFHWPAEAKRDFYFRIADEAPVSTVYLGEVICSKREPYFAPHYGQVAERLTRAGKTVVFSTLAEAMIQRERRMIAELCGQDGFPVLHRGRFKGLEQGNATSAAGQPLPDIDAGQIRLALSHTRIAQHKP